MRAPSGARNAATLEPGGERAQRDRDQDRHQDGHHQRDELPEEQPEHEQARRKQHRPVGDGCVVAGLSHALQAIPGRRY